ncbi:DUF2017 family protein [Dermatophilus congolensis]|uniref:Domain of uncharacterized function (DUF2017) n=1 Tax=Dermatophilus congolensis TaxID=1863 RepID=A0AA46H013_9MICO|nr:DUF2017 family protein [Dermatophilus congolensis]MBO3142519.1 DUF2017 family protein [Dermatophilus congolensis]MBO3151509.1 DUF2017 family protein [Dermatophilus congolensis]MBO3161489.1 DUF2017 family protein [Dermatophilus congolensis]MBO3162794.1 DUF2017 family protein [Dermatophilus congolensis]MBO3176348.1 DUF2017 family protein [Dermatophilus congolensis]
MMNYGFTRDGDRFVADLDDEEREIIVGLIEQTAELLEQAAPAEPENHHPDSEDSTGDMGGEFERMMTAAGLGPTSQDPSSNPPTTGFINENALAADPALGRLLPDAHHDDPLAAAEFRAWSGDTVRRTKLNRLHAAADTLRPDGTPLNIDEDTAVTVLIALTDLRLVLAERLGLHDEEDVERLEQAIQDGQMNDATALILTYDFLTWLQETLASSLT